jgi:MoaA/NifB/PqqE/SkfB family radical SAM enzyme
MSPAAIKDMTFLQFKKIFGRLKEAMHIVFCGFGEPLLNKDIFEMIAYSKRKGKITTLTTNGILLDDRAIDNILGSKLDVLSISIKTSKKIFFARLPFRRKIFRFNYRNVMDLVKKRNG